MEVFDFSDNAQPCEEPAVFPYGFYDGVVFLVDDNPVVCGGYTGYSFIKSCYQYNPTGNAWEEVNCMNITCLLVCDIKCSEPYFNAYSKMYAARPQ